MIGCEFRSPQGPQRGATAGSGCGDFFRDVEHYSALTLSKEPNAMPNEVYKSGSLSEYLRHSTRKAMPFFLANGGTSKSPSERHTQTGPGRGMAKERCSIRHMAAGRQDIVALYGE